MYVVCNSVHFELDGEKKIINVMISSGIIGSEIVI